jgi:hypothetical protein
MQLADCIIQADVEIDERVGRPQLLLQFFRGKQPCLDWRPVRVILEMAVPVA